MTSWPKGHAIRQCPALLSRLPHCISGVYTLSMGGVELEAALKVKAAAELACRGYFPNVSSLRQSSPCCCSSAVLVLLALRVLIYEPVREGRFVPAAATAAAAKCQANTGANTAQQDVPSRQKVDEAVLLAPAGPEDTTSTVTDSMALPSTGPDSGVKPTTASGANKPVVILADSTESDSTSSSSGGGSVDVQLSTAAAAAGSASAQPSNAHTTAAAGAGDLAGGASKSAPATQSAQEAAKRKETPAQAVLRRIAATHATFAFSGLWHMLIFYYATGLVTYHWPLFFSVQAPIMVAETVLKLYARRLGLKLPTAVSVSLTNFLLIVVAQPLFFGPCDWSGMCTAMMDNVKGAFV